MRRIGVLLTGLAAFWPAGSILAQIPGDAGEEAIERRIERITRNPVIRQLLEDKQGLTPAQRKVISDAVDAMPPEDLDANLRELGLSSEGSVFARRERLKIALGAEDPPPLPQDQPSPRIAIENAAEGEYMQGEDDERGLLKLYGRIRVRLPDGVFFADQVIFDTTRQEVYGAGNVVYQEPDAEIRAERILYNVKLQTGIVYNASGYRQPLYFIGQSMRQMGEDRYALSHAFFTSCAEEKPHYNFTAKRLWLYDDGKVFAAGVLYHVGGVPLLPLPFLYASDWGTGVIAQAGYSDIQGWFLQTTYQFSDPESALSAWRPQAYRFKLDAYQFTGEAGGVELYKFSPNLNYVLDLGVANYQRYGIAGDIRGSNNIRGDDSLRITNQVLVCNGTPGQPGYYCTTGEEEEMWYKAFAVVNYRKADLSENSVRNVYLRYEDYANQLYEYEYGGRYQPTSTIPALFANNEAGRGLVRPITNWNLVYSEQFDSLRVRVAAQRQNIWFNTRTDIPTEGEYFPSNDIAPDVDVEKRFNLGNIPYLNAPLYWDHRLGSELTKQYTISQNATGAYKQQEFQNLNKNEYETSFRTFLHWYPFITLTPRLGYGIQKTVAEAKQNSPENEAALAREAAKDSYQYWFTEPSLLIGPDLLFFRATHRYKQSFKEEENDEPLVNTTPGFDGAQKVNETELAVEFNPLSDVHFSVESVYDWRELPYPVEQKDRWYFPVFRSDIYLDLLNPFSRERESLLTRNRVHFMGVRLSNDYVYDPQLKRDHSNLVGVSFETGGFDLWLIERLRYFETSFYWYHYYPDPNLDHMRYAFKADLQLWSWGYLEMELESRAVDTGRYSRDSVDREGNPDFTPFDGDIANGTGLRGRQRRESTVFNVAYFNAALILDLHDWEYRFGYELEQRAIFSASTSVDAVNFYDNRFFFSMTLLRFDIGGVGSRPSRFLLDRQQVRPGDLGRLPIGSERIN